MARTNTKTKNTFNEKTHEGAPAARTDVEQQLRRSVMSCMLWEHEFYEDGQEIAVRIFELAQQVSPATLSLLAIEAREQMKLRHVSLLLLVALCKSGSGNIIVSKTIARVIKRADELAELVALYWKLNVQPSPTKKAALSAQLKLGLAEAFNKFDAYQIAKYDRANEVRLRDVAFMVHVKPKNNDHATLIAKLVNKSYFPVQTKSGFKVKTKLKLSKVSVGLESPDTWEVALSAGGDKKVEFTRLLEDGKLGYLALLRNLRNMANAAVDRNLVTDAIKARFGAGNVYPFRYIAAARAAPEYEPALDQALIASVGDMKQLPGTTLILVDVSGSMDAPLSARSDLTRMDAAAALAAVFPGEDVRTFSFSTMTLEVPRRLGIAGIEAIVKSQRHGGTALAAAIRDANKIKHDRIIVITDEQSQDGSANPVVENAYMINVASYRNGIGYGKWTHFDGFSENILRFIAEFEGVHDEVADDE